VLGVTQASTAPTKTNLASNELTRARTAAGSPAWGYGLRPSAPNCAADYYARCPRPTAGTTNTPKALRTADTMRMFCSYVSDPDYGGIESVNSDSVATPAQVFFEWNTATHVQDNEQSPAKRAFTSESCRTSLTTRTTGLR